MKQNKHNLKENLESLLNLPVYPVNENMRVEEYINKRWEGLMKLRLTHKNSQKDMEKITEAAYKSVLQLIKEGQEGYALSDYLLTYCIQFNLKSHYQEIRANAMKRLSIEKDKNLINLIRDFIGNLDERYEK